MSLVTVLESKGRRVTKIQCGNSTYMSLIALSEERELDHPRVLRLVRRGYFNLKEPSRGDREYQLKINSIKYKGTTFISFMDVDAIINYYKNGLLS